jgi:hypothetical protein
MRVPFFLGKTALRAVVSVYTYRRTALAGEECRCVLE